MTCRISARQCLFSVMAAGLLLVSTGLTTARAETIFPTESYLPMHEKLLRQDRAFYSFLALPFGWSLEANMINADQKTLINEFLDQTESEDVKAVTGKHPYEMFTNYEEHGDLGMFGGVAIAGTAFKYMTLKRDGGTTAELVAARREVVRAIEGQHVFWEVTGTPGVLARGIRRLVDEDPEAPPIPDTPRELTPLFDGDHKPLPTAKNNGEWRDDNSNGVLPADTWIWVDSASKDQLVGQIFAMVLLYDAAAGDPDIDQSLIAQMQTDARATAQMLMTMRDISTLEGPSGVGEYDLIIMDADGRPTFFHDLNPYSLEKFYLPVDAGSYNIFNLSMALGVMKGLYHVTGDPDIETYTFGELMGNRGYLDMIDAPLDDTNVIDYIYANEKTNFSNVNMIATAIWLALYTETDPAVEAPLQNFLEKRWWNRPDQTRTARLAKMPFYSLVWMGLTDKGFDRAAADEAAANLTGFQVGPYFNDRVVLNCDETEIAAGQCLAIDDVTEITLDNTTSRGNQPVSTVALDPTIRPPSNFDARSDPFEVNGGGSLTMNPGGDLIAAYWMGRYLPLNAVGTASRSPNARSHMQVPGLSVAENPPETAEIVDVEIIEDATATDHGSNADGGNDLNATDIAGHDISTSDTTGTDDGTEDKPGSGCSAAGRSSGSGALALVILGMGLISFAAVRKRRALSGN